jgi:hypothetical protein
LISKRNTGIVMIYSFKCCIPSSADETTHSRSLNSTLRCILAVFF